jgi:sulfite exporter TauE/SafE
MWTLVGAIFIASLVGSLHCAGMCGAFLAIAISDPGRRVSKWKMQAGYHGGRLLSYTTLGAIAGSLGAAANIAGGLAGLQPVAAMFAGAVMIVFGVVSLSRLMGWSMARLSPPGWLLSASQGAHRRAMDAPPMLRSITIGLLTTLLPCGWLWAFVVTAAGTAHPLSGAIAMAVFWAGTLPVMVSLGAGIQGGLGHLGRRLPAAACVLMVVVGLWTLVGRSMINLPSAHAAPTTQPSSVPDPNEVPECCRP